MYKNSADMAHQEATWAAMFRGVYLFNNILWLLPGNFSSSMKGSGDIDSPLAISETKRIKSMITTM